MAKCAKGLRGKHVNFVVVVVVIQPPRCVVVVLVIFPQLHVSKWIVKAVFDFGYRLSARVVPVNFLAIEVRQDDLRIGDDGP